MASHLFCVLSRVSSSLPMPRPLTHLLLPPTLCLGLLCLLPATAHPQHYTIRTRTLGRATQSWRIDGTIRADRPLIQGLELYGHDLTGSRTDAVSAQVALRYRTSLDRLGLTSQGGGSNALEIEGLVVDLFSLTLWPHHDLRLTLGRQWHASALGVVEIDGAQAQGVIGEADSLALELTAFGGRHPLRDNRLLASSNLDIQALPTALEAQASSWSAGAALKLWQDGLFSLSGAYSRRWITQIPDGPHDHVLGAEVLAAAATLEPAPFLLLSSTLRIHPVLGRVERAEARADAALEPSDLLALRLSLGGGRWRPVFDLSSIFNLFDPQPHDDLFLTAHIQAWRTHTLTLKSWARRYGIDDDQAGDVALGASASYGILFDLLELPWRWDSTLSTEQGADTIGGSPSLLDTALSVSWWQGKITTHGRFIGLLVDRDHHRLKPEAAFSGILGLRAEVFENATLNLLIEQRRSRNDVPSAGVWALWSMEFNP